MHFTSPTIRVAAVVCAVAGALAASVGCGDDETQAASATTAQSSSTGAGASTSSSAGTGGGGGGSGGATGSGGTSGTQGGGGSMCHGDQSAWDAIEKMDIPCQENSDCCVVVNNCTSEAQVVGSADSAAAAAAFPYCDSDCVGCEPPMIGVECATGKCVGHFPDPRQPPELGTNHCGVNGVTPTGGPPKQSFTCDG